MESFALFTSRTRGFGDSSVLLQWHSRSSVGFCDAAVVYLRIEGETQVCVRFIAAKTHVAPLGGMTIPRLELLSALLLSKLIVNVQAALQPETTLGDLMCYTDS